MQKLLLQCSNIEDAQKIKAQIESRLPYSVLLSFGKLETENSLTQQGIHLFMYDNNVIDEEDVQFLMDIRNLGYVYPILVLTQEVSKELSGIAEKFKTHILEKPYDQKALQGVTRKLMVQKSISQQRHRRFKTHQTAHVETYVTAETLVSKMFNLSKGGAYLEFSYRPDLGIGDIIRLQVPLAELNKHREVNAKVVWTTRRGSYSGGFGVGLRFVQEREVYRQVLERM